MGMVTSLCCWWSYCHASPAVPGCGLRGEIPRSCVEYPRSRNMDRRPPQLISSAPVLRLPSACNRSPRQASRAARQGSAGWSGHPPGCRGRCVPCCGIAGLIVSRLGNGSKAGSWSSGAISHRMVPTSSHFAMDGKWSGLSKGSWSAISRAPYLKPQPSFKRRLLERRRSSLIMIDIG